jgi:histidyl-tRNA synthetase
MKYANKINARFTAIIGTAELAQNTCVIKNMQTGEQETVGLNALGEWCAGV